MSVRRLIGAASAVGVLTAASLLGATGLASAQEQEWFTLTASGSGDEVVPAGSGAEGTALVGSMSLTEDGQMTYTIDVQGNEEELTSANVYRGAEGENGDVVIELNVNAINNGDEQEIEIDSGLAERLIANPENWYISAQSESFEAPGGVARAQLVGEENVDEPELINTGSGGQFAASQSGPGAGTIAAGALLIASAAGGAFALRRRSGTDDA
jgi:hypothetical protein